MCGSLCVFEPETVPEARIMCEGTVLSVAAPSSRHQSSPASSLAGWLEPQAVGDQVDVIVYLFLKLVWTEGRGGRCGHADMEVLSPFSEIIKTANTGFEVSEPIKR